ncbi:MAG TPA: MDR family MFS transporter [Aldersonia sp.]
MILPGLFLATLDQTIVTTAVRTIADDLDSYSRQAWVTTAYLAAATVTTPLYGKLADGYGRKPLFAAAITLFTVGSALCAFAPSMPALAAFRTVQGLGAGGLIALTFTMIGDLVPARERSRYQGYILAVYGIASLLGPVIGGLLAGQSTILGITGWRWVFLVNVPIGLATLVAVITRLRVPSPPRTRTSVDWLGAALLTAGLVPLLVVADQGRTWGWASGRSSVCLAVGVVGILGFVLVEARLGERALLPVRAFGNRAFALGVLISFLIGAVVYGAIAVIPQFLQVVKGSTPTVAGLQMVPAVAGLVVGSVVCSRMISRTGRYRKLTMSGIAILTAGSLLANRVTAEIDVSAIMAFIFVVGIGLGCVLHPLTVAIQNSLPPTDLGVSTAAAGFFRQIGGTLGVAVFLSIVFAQLPGRLTSELETASETAEFRAAVARSMSGSDPAVTALARGLAARDPDSLGVVREDSSIVQRLDPALAQPFADAFADAFRAVSPVVCGLGVAALLAAVMWKELPLRRGSQTPEVSAVEGAAQMKNLSSGPHSAVTE